LSESATIKLLKALAEKEGRETELISLYIPAGHQASEVINLLEEEYGIASNIKSERTRKNVRDAIAKVAKHIKLFRELPENGLVIFCGAIPQEDGKERIETYVVIPEEPIGLFLYCCDSKFHVEPLLRRLKEQ